MKNEHLGRRNGLRLLSCFVAAVVLAACTMAENLPQIREGMNRAEVEAVMGSPDSFKRTGEFTAIEYKNRLISGWSWDRVDYSFIFKNSRLVEWGAGQVRQAANNPQVLVIHNF
jgi:hypothetical protein